MRRILDSIAVSRREKSAGAQPDANKFFVISMVVDGNEARTDGESTEQSDNARRMAVALEYSPDITVE